MLLNTFWRRQRQFYVANFVFCVSCVLGLAQSHGAPNDNRSALPPLLAHKKIPENLYVPNFDPKTGDFNVPGAQAHLGAITSGTTVADDLFHDYPTKHTLRGTLAYALDVFKVPPASYVVVHNFTGDQKADASSIKSYAIEGTGVNLAHNPVLSPSKRFVAFTVGLVNQYPCYHLYVLDLQTNTLTLASHHVFNYDEILWSPDETYLAFLQEGETRNDSHFEENPWGAYKSLRLMLCQWRTGKTQPVVDRDTEGGFCWTAPHTMIYALGPISLTKDKKLIQRPALYEADAETNVSHIFIKDAYQPIVSPDGQSIAFFGSENPAKPIPLASNWSASPAYSALCVTRGNSNSRLALNTYPNRFPVVVWLHDGHHLLTIERKDSSTGTTNIVRKCDIDTGRWQNIGSFTATKIPETDPSYPRFSVEDVSVDDSALFSAIVQISDAHLNANATQKSDVAYKRRQLLESMDLITGQIETIFSSLTDDIGSSEPHVQLRTPTDFDWHSESTVDQLAPAKTIAVP